MEKGPVKTALVLAGVELPPGLPVQVRSAESALEAAALLARTRPDWILIRADAGWHRAFVESLPAAQRPAVIAVGKGTVRAQAVDEWVRDLGDPDELTQRLALAVERGQERRRTARRAFVDPLTGLPNRRAVVRALVREAARAKRSGGELAFVMLDLDGFKQINESRGHLEGDRVLHRVGMALRRAVRGEDLCGRIGGDEFALVLSGGRPEADEATRRSARFIRRAGVTATTAIGLWHPGEPLRELYRRTDEFLRAAKDRRRAQSPSPAVAPARLIPREPAFLDEVRGPGAP